MRVLYSFPHPVGRAGIGVTAYHQVEGVLRHGAEVTLVCTSLERPLPGATVVETMSIRGRRIPHRLVGVDRAYRFHDRRAARLLASLAGAVDVVHAWPKAAIRTFGAAHSLGIPGLREIPNTHTAYAFDAVAREESKLGIAAVAGHSHTFDRAVLAQEEREYELADVLLVPSEFVRRTFLDRGVPAEKLALHAYGFDEARFPAPTPESGADPSAGLRALFVGSCEPRKGLHYALQAWLASGAAETGRFVVCGRFVPGYREAVEQWLVHPSVEVRGFVDDPGALMRESDVFVFPSVEEGSALVTYEAQASGCVLVVSDATGARVDERRGLVHAAGDLEALTAHLRLLNADRGRLAQLREATLAARDELTWDHAAKELVAVYESVAR